MLLMLLVSSQYLITVPHHRCSLGCVDGVGLPCRVQVVTLVCMCVRMRMQSVHPCVLANALLQLYVAVTVCVCVHEGV